uniref:Uncharacterized protein n=1 Tax=viral metagenome TaxID=1070528 RepID=A0A6M3KV13_9ZZZZ
MLKVGVRILQRWRNPLDELYKPALAEAVRAAQENIDAGHIHRGLIDLAKPHTVLKRIRVLRESGPQPPPRSWRKKELLTFGRIRLGIELDPKTNVNELRIIIDHECEKRREQKLVTAREERTTELDVQAAKFVLTNIGDPEKRWMVKEGRVHDTTGTLARLIAEINDCPEPILEPAKLNDGAAVQGESEEQVLEIEQPLLDNG